MPNGEDFYTTDWERQRLVDRVRFLLYGGAYKRRFAARAAQHGILFSSRFSSREPSHRLLFAGASVAILAVIGWLGWQLHEARTGNQAMAADLHALRQQSERRQSPGPPSETNQRAPEVRIVRENADEVLLRRQLELQQARADLKRAEAGSLYLSEQLRQAREQLDSLRQEMAGSKTVEIRLLDQLRERELRLSDMTAEVTRLQAERSADTEIIAGQKFRLRELTDQINEASDAIARERKMLVADVDIRELMGARSLHIVDVFDVDGKGKTQRPFGRVFYTEGKSLLFYAFDLKNGSAFQAWGQQEAREESAQSLGIFQLDDQKQNRWVLKFDDPKVLAGINSVFVTAEPPGGSVKPNRRKMLYANLNATPPNHP
jgi:hypothetical protein